MVNFYAIIYKRGEKMNINIKTNISNKFKEIMIFIEAPKLSKEVQNVVDYVSELNSLPAQISANKNNEIYFINVKDIIYFFSKDKYNYIKTNKDEYRIKYKLYELEEKLDKRNFVRISKSCIINMNQVKCFDTNILGTIKVKMKDDTENVVSKRNVSYIMKILNERGKI